MRRRSRRKAGFRRTPWFTWTLLVALTIGGCNHLDNMEAQHKDALIIAERTGLQQGYQHGRQEGYDAGYAEGYEQGQDDAE